MEKDNQLRLFGIAGLIGSILFSIFSILHPPTFNPWNTYGTFEKVSHHSFWVLDHIFIVIGITLWLIGLVAGQGLLQSGSLLTRVGSRVFTLSLTVWVIILTFEIGVIPLLVDAIKQHQTDTLMTIWFVVFCFGLLGGYFAFIFTWLGILLYSSAMKVENSPSWFRKWGLYSGSLGILGIIVGLLNIEFIVPILAVTSGPAFIWSNGLLIFMVKGSQAFSSK